MEAGLDFGLLKDRIKVELTYYDARVRNALFPRSATGPVRHHRAENSIEIMNRGLEAALAAWLIDTPAFRWNMTLAYEWNRNRITDVGPAAIDDSLPIYRQRADGTWEHVGWRPTRSDLLHTGESLDEIFGYGIAGYDAVTNRHEWTTRLFSRGRSQPAHMGSVFSSFRIGDGLRLVFQLRGEVGAVMVGRLQLPGPEREGPRRRHRDQLDEDVPGASTAEEVPPVGQDAFLTTGPRVARALAYLRSTTNRRPAVAREPPGPATASSRS